MIKYYLLLLISLSSCCVQAQTIREETESFDHYLELISELVTNSEEETDFNDLAFELNNLWESPININNSDAYELARLFWLSELQLNNLIAYVEKQKPLVSIYELAFIPGFDSTLVMSIKPFIVLSDVSDTYRYKPKSRHWLLYRAGRQIETEKGFRENKYKGDAWKHNFRYKVEHGDKFSAGINVEKDAGESLFKGSNRAGPDYYSGYVKLNNLGIIRTICFGNYSYGFGQGLVAGPGFVLGKSSQSVNLTQKDAGIRPYTSTDENRYYQGVAASLSLKPVELSVFVSYKAIDANVSLKDSSGNVLEVSSLQNTGYHSTQTEIEDENSLKEFTIGAHLAYKTEKLSTGISFVHTAFNAEIVPEPSDYNQFYFKGRSQQNIGIDYKYNFSNTVIFGESALDANGNMAFLNGITSEVSGRLQINVLHRYYSHKYHSFYGKAFGENTRVQNEEGVYAGIRMPLFKGVNVAFYADYFRFPWLKQGVDAPSYGKEYMIHTDFRLSGSFSAYLQYRYKEKQLNLSDSADVLNNVENSQSNRIRLNLAYQPASHLSLATRMEYGFHSAGNATEDNSYLLYQDIKYAFARCPLQLYLRYSVFEADNFNSRIYAYESDVLYAFSVNMFYRKGQRYYAMLKYSPTNRIDFWIKYSQTVYPNETVIGSGLNEINGNSRSDFRIQVILKL